MNKESTKMSKKETTIKSKKLRLATVDDAQQNVEELLVPNASPIQPEFVSKVHSSYNLFPTPVFFYDLKRELTAEELAFVSDTENTTPNSGNRTSANRNVLDDSVLSSIRAFCQESMDDYFTQVHAPSTDLKLRFTQSWINFTEKGQFHHKHAHPNSFISGVFYAQTTENDKIHFYNDGYQRLKVDTTSFNLWNSESWWLPATKNHLILFPSYLTHMVETVMSESTRISISFNTFPVGHMGNDNSLTGLHV